MKECASDSGGWNEVLTGLAEGQELQNIQHREYPWKYVQVIVVNV